MTSTGTALRRTMLIVTLAAAVGALVSWRRGSVATPTPAAPPQWPPLAATLRRGGPEPTLELTPEPEPEPRSEPGWVSANDDGSTPASHPIKAKASSGIYHVPGGRFYDRTSPDRCYHTAAAAEADGYRRSKS